MKKSILLSLFSMPLAICSTGCSREPIVINNAIVYLVHEDCYSYGKINGTQWQTVFVGEYSSEVEAVPNKGYVFVKWSDGKIDSRRSDLAESKNVNGPVLFYAFFVKADE